MEPGSPAAETGLRPGDIVLSLDGAKVDGRFPEQLPPIQNMIAGYSVGSIIHIKVKRNGDTLDFEVTTEKLESRVGEKWVFEDWGLSVQKVSRANARERKLDSEDGVLVIGTQPAFPAAEAGLRRGDIIYKVNRHAIETLDGLRQVYDDFQSEPNDILLEVQRHHQVSYYVLKPE